MGATSSRPYGNFRHEVYPLFVDILASLPDGIRVLDIGAGPGHLALEFFKAHEESKNHFTLIDSSVKLLEIASSRLSSFVSQVRTLHRSLCSANWDRGLGKFDAIVSNNVPFPVKPQGQRIFYQTCFARLKRNGIFLFQEPCAYSGTENPCGGDPLTDLLSSLPDGILPSSPHMAKRQQRKLETEKQNALAAHRAAIAEAEAKGIAFPPETGWEFATVETHLKSLRTAGFSAGCIWKKRESAVLLGVKGRAELKTGT